METPTTAVKTTTSGFPRQKLSISKKGDRWMKLCIDRAIDMTVLRPDDGYRASRYNIEENYNLANGIIDEENMYKITNPFGVSGLDREIADYPLVRPRLNVLIGEEANRMFDFKCLVANPDAISVKEKQVKEEYINRLGEIVLRQAFDEDEAKKQLEELNKWKDFEVQDLHERMASQILKYLYQKLRLKYVFNDGFEDALIAGEEIYRIDLVSGEPIVRRVNPLNLYVIRSNDSPFVEDADIIVEDGYHNIGYVIDNFYEYLTDGEIDKLERDTMGISSPRPGGTLNYSENEPYPITDSLIEVDTDNLSINTTIDSPYDEYGRIRVTRVVWRSMRKVGELTSFDNDGRVIKKYVSEYYEPDEEMGEKVKWLWINEWWEGTRIGDDIYVKMGPRPIQFRRFTNKSASSSGYVGTLYNINGTTVRSLMDVMKPYQYLYDEFMDRIKTAFEKFKGPMIELDFAKMPEGWEVEKWMHYAENMGYLIVDSFKEGRKGSATGKLAGAFNTTGKVLNPDLGNYIQHHIMMLEYIEKQIGLISGLPDQRLGAIKSSETVGGVERAVTQSSHITEVLFSLHDQTKIRVLETLLETAKLAYKNDQKKIQYTLDDMSAAILDVDGELFNEAEYGIFVTDGRKSTELMQMMRQLAHAGLQNGILNFTSLLDIYMSPSISVMRRKLETAEKEMMERQQEVQQQQIKAQQEAAAAEQQRAQAELELKQAELMQKEREAILDAQTKITVAEINAASKEGSPEDEEFKKELEKQKLELDKQKLDLDRKEKEQKLALEKRKLKETERTNKAKESIARNKPSGTSKS